MVRAPPAEFGELMTGPSSLLKKSDGFEMSERKESSWGASRIDQDQVGRRLCVRADDPAGVPALATGDSSALRNRWAVMSSVLALWRPVVT
jgi:hypothetical protein